MIVAFDQPGQHLLLLLRQEGEIFGGVLGLQLADLVLVDPLAPQFLQDGIGSVLHEEKC